MAVSYPSRLRTGVASALCTVEDTGVFTTPWSASITCGRGSGDFDEKVYAENTREYTGKDADVPTANRPDF